MAINITKSFTVPAILRNYYDQSALICHYARVATLVWAAFMCVNCGLTLHTFPHILYVGTSPHFTRAHFQKCKNLI